MRPLAWLGRLVEVAGHRAESLRLRDGLERITGAKSLDEALRIARSTLSTTTTLGGKP